MAPSGIPGLRGTDHVGFTVPDLEEAVTFFRDVIGCEIFYSLGAQEDSKGTRMRDKLGVDPGRVSAHSPGAMQKRREL